MKQQKKYSLILMVKNIISKISSDNITGYAAQSCFYILVSIIPFLMVLMSLLQYLPFTSDDVLNLIKDIIPAQVYPYVATIVSDLYSNSSVTLISITAIGLIWATGKGFMSIMKGLNKIYNVEDKKSWFVQRTISALYTLVLMAAIIATIIIVVFGNQLLHFMSLHLPSIAVIFAAILTNKMLLTTCGMLLIILTMFKFIPNRKTSFAKELPGALLASFGWYGFSALFSVYIDNSPNFSYMYGSLTTLIIGLLWMYFCMIIVFYGAELNTFIDNKILTPLNIHPIDSEDNKDKGQN